MDLESATSERPAKRVRQACEPCRRKKAKCPGEQPTCSLCARLGQTCAYAAEHRRPLTNGLSSSGDLASGLSTSESRITRILEDRLGNCEAKMNELLDALRRNTSNQLQEKEASARPSPLASVLNTSSLNTFTPLPRWEKVLSIAELYLLYCDGQPLPLFHRHSFLHSLPTRDPELIYAILALSVRFSNDEASSPDELPSLINGYTEVARSLVMKRVSEGPVELSTLQSLCLLSLVDFTNGNTHRSSIHCSLAMNLAQCANLASESHSSQLSSLEERRRCFWSICLLKRLHGVDVENLDFPEGNFPPFPESPSRPPPPDSVGDAVDETRSSGMHDQGILAYMIMLSGVFAKTAKYVRRHGKPGNLPPWSSESDYSKILAAQMDLETQMPYIHRFKPASLNERTSEDLQTRRDYWGPWLLNQFLYHTILCLVNHPLLLSLSLRNFRSTIPEIFLQHSSDLISSHTTWIIHFINFFEERCYTISDPFLGYSAAVVATIELQLSFTENAAIRDEKRDRFYRCVRFVQRLGQKWPHMARLADRLQKLEDAVSASYQPASGLLNKYLLIDLSRFWEILEYSSNSDTDSARRMFGDSLYSEPPAIAAEVSQTSPLPEPFRLQSHHTSASSPGSQRNVPTSLLTGEQCPMGSMSSPRSPDPMNDEFSILAANFFSQAQDFLPRVDSRDGFGHL
ncbi:putative C6 transcription factor [Aspergillus saccharolyticus JOP 1030-1]|uniref:Zn(2)-C6 fungal-type domain-containing protein n=1 Tax=Aspergillus saccharolyticus JOP 1030-1 TaxID=1450539 RepID=A0A318Z380_9EURO|nr:hypothetical protein BP01DRAFT_307493 [Aspergillus saccharolyticus JOP 1030-1]PYH40757.1 hypothetical protein BP01DRAFT_307493 [Aspergillus saccharolyticus JOP 1030-1]